MNPDQTAPIGADCSGSTLFASILNLSVMLGNYFAADDFSRRHFQMHFFLGAFRVKGKYTDQRILTTVTNFHTYCRCNH